MSTTAYPSTSFKFDQLERRLRELQEDVRAQAETIQILRTEVIKLIDRIAKLEKAKS